VDVSTATLLVLIDAGKQSAPVFLPVRQTSSDHPRSPSPADTGDIYRVTAAARRPGDTVGRVLAIDLDRPSVPVTYRVIRDTVTSRAFDVTHFGGVMTLTSMTSLLRDVTHVNVTVQAVITDSNRTASTLVQFELIDDVGGLAWECDVQQATVIENSARATSVATLKARTDDDVTYHIVNGNRQHAFVIDQTTVSYYQCHITTL